MIMSLSLVNHDVLTTRLQDMTLCDIYLEMSVPLLLSQVTSLKAISLLRPKQHSINHRFWKDW